MASELIKRNCEVALTMGNHPRVVTPKPPQANLFYVLALVPDEADNMFFVLTQEEINREIVSGD